MSVGKVYHRDLKLENVLVTKDGTVKVTDFGMAKDTTGQCCQLLDSLSAVAHHHGAVAVAGLSLPKTRRVGTIAYMAPEVADAAGHYDGACADVWSLGVMLYVMAVCNYPFGHDGPDGDSTRVVSTRLLVVACSCLLVRQAAWARWAPPLGGGADEDDDDEMKAMAMIAMMTTTTMAGPLTLRMAVLVLASGAGQNPEG